MPSATPSPSAALPATFYRHPDAGMLLIAGEDRVDFLNRQTSNDVRRLAPNQAVMTVLTSPTARIEDVLWLVERAEGIGAMTLPGRGSRTYRALRGKIFFMDRVTVTDLSAETCQFDLGGGEADRILQALGWAAPQPGEVAHGDWGEGAVTVAGGWSAGVGRFRLVAPAVAADALAEALAQAGAQPLTAEAYEVRRVEAGQPGPQGELTEEYNPLEAGLEHAISHNKGCYTGQEVIARQVTYDKVTRRLVGLRLAQTAPAGARLLQDGKPAGELTSIVVSPRFGPIGLGYVRRPYGEPGSALTAAAEGTEVAATVAALPFA